MEWLTSIGLLLGGLTFGLGDLSLGWLTSFGDLGLGWPSSLGLLSVCLLSSFGDLSLGWPSSLGLLFVCPLLFNLFGCLKFRLCVLLYLGLAGPL